MMNTRWLPLWILLGAAAIFAAQTLYFYPLLPERIASHFGPNGRPDGWASKDSFFVTMGGVLLFVWGLLSGIAAWLPRLPAEQVNLPHKDYWLAPERAAQTYAVLSGHILLIGSAAIALLLTANQYALLANVPRSGEPRLGAGLPFVMVAFIWVLAASTVLMVRRFSRRPAE